MGQSTDAILFYGFCIDDSSNDHELIDELEDYSEDLALKAYDLPLDFSVWQDKGAIVKVNVGRHCSADCPMYFVFVQGSKIRANRGYPQQVAAPLASSDLQWDCWLREFCGKTGLAQPINIGWWLVSDWS